MREAVQLSLVIPVHDHFAQLAQTMTSALAALRSCRQGWEIIVVDDASSLDPAPYLSNAAILLRNPTRLGFGPSINRGVAAARGEFCCLLNSDMYVADDFFQDWLGDFPSDNTIAVCGAIEEPDGTNSGMKWLHMGDFGPVFRFSSAIDISDRQVVPYANGGGSFFRRRPYLELGGFDDLFAPYYWEDADFGFRAWKRGYETYYAPRLRLRHDRGTSTGADAPRKVKRIKQRNRHFFHWSNFTDSSLTTILRRFLLPEITSYLVAGRARRLAWLVRDFARIRDVLERRQILQRDSTCPDYVLLERLKGDPKCALPRP